MKYGDLVYIPQDVTLLDSNNIYIDKTQKPVVGVFLKETPAGAPFQAGTYTIYVQGRENVVERRKVYPMEERC